MRYDNTLARFDNPNLLIVEGHDDLHSVVGLMQHHVSWPDGVDNAPVYIKIGKSASEILEPGYLTAEIKASYVKQVGVMIDADVHSEGRYQSKWISP